MTQHNPTDEGLSLHQALLTRRSNLPPGASPLAHAPPEPQEDPDPAWPLASARITTESRENIERAPEGTRFYCVASEGGDVHCAASRGQGDLPSEARSTLAGQSVEPISPSYLGTGHQQVARLAGLTFDEATARVGYVDGEGYGLSIEKVDACERRYTWRSAFNCKVSPDGSRTLPDPIAHVIQSGVESSFPPCPCEPTDTDPHTP
ncbi:MAG: hypothetical protein CMH57_15525 [Myxococcales bacterium]|nr:hypothetical protein [Myxococcales bacterium]